MFKNFNVSIHLVGISLNYYVKHYGYCEQYQELGHEM